MAQKEFELKSCIKCDSAIESDVMDLDELNCSKMTGRWAEGLWIEIVEQPRSMRKMVNIVIAVQKFKSNCKVQSTMFSDQELFNIIMDNMVEARVAMTMDCDVAETYNKQDKVIECTICDKLQKNLVQSTGAPILQAVTLKGGNLSKRVWLHLSSYTPPSCSNLNGQPVCLGIAKSNLYLSCTDVSGTPTLSIEELQNKESLKIIGANNDMERFLFLRKGTGDSINTFESVKYHGWFISTTQYDYDPVDMCKENDVSRLRVFTLQDKTVVSDS